MISTFAPSETHWSACVFCFCGSPCAFTTLAATWAALKAFSRYGLSNCSQRTDVFVSGISPQARMPALFVVACLVPAVATATAVVAAIATTASAIDLRETFVTYSLLLRGPGTLTRTVPGFTCIRRRSRALVRGQGARPPGGPCPDVARSGASISDWRHAMPTMRNSAQG